MIYDTKLGGMELIDEAANLIKCGELVAFPTETVYGLGANALSPAAVNKIFLAKNRPFDNPLIVHVSDVEQAKQVAFVSEDAERLFAKYSPGPITVVLPKRECVPEEVTGQIKTVGIRIPNNKIALELIKRSGCPIAAPSANASKRVSPTKAEYVYDDMKGRIPLILDGGECKVGIESTVISLAEDIPTILRPGGITKEMLSDIFPKVTNFKGQVKVAEAPGMKYTHYAPTVEECLMFDNILKANQYYDEKVKSGKKTVVLVSAKHMMKEGGRQYISMGKNGTEIAHNIFGILRECEKKYDVILIEQLPEFDIFYSVMNRLKKSTGGKTL